MPAAFAAAINNTSSATPKSIPMNCSNDFCIGVGSVRTGSAHAFRIFVLGSSVGTRGAMTFNASLAPSAVTPGRSLPKMFIQ